MKKPTPEQLEQALNEFEVAESKFRSAVAALAHAKKRGREQDVHSARERWDSAVRTRLWAGHKVASLLSRMMPRDTSKVAVLIASRSPEPHR